MDIDIINDYNNNKKLLSELRRRKQRIKKTNNKNFMFTLLHISQFFLILGGIGWGVVSFFELYNKKGDGFDMMKSVLTGIIGCSAVNLLLNIGIKPSFISDHILPPTSITESYPVNHDMIYTLETKPNSIVIYWGAKKTKHNITKTKDNAHGRFENSGVTRSDMNGIAQIRLQIPGNIMTNDFVPRIMNKHFSYRLLDNKGYLSDIFVEDIHDYCLDNVVIPEKPVPLYSKDNMEKFIIPVETMEPIII